MRAALTFALLLLAVPARAERAWFPVTGEATAGGAFGKHALGQGNLFLGYQDGFRDKSGESGMIFAGGPVYTQRWFEPHSVGCTTAGAYVDATTVQSNHCGNGWSLGLHARVGFAWDMTDDHHHEVPDHVLYLGVTALLAGTEPRLSLDDGYSHDHQLKGVRAVMGWNFLAWTRWVGHLPIERKDDAGNLLLFPYAVINKLEVQYEHVSLSGAKGDDRFGIVSGFGF